MLHFNPKGYDLMAEKLFEIAVPAVAENGSSGQPPPTTTTMSDLPPSIRILAFGASLIEGFVVTPRGVLQFHPCTIELERRLSAHFPAHRIEIVNCGMSGDCAVSMPWRLQKVLACEHAFDLAFFLGGTNDIGQAMHEVIGDRTADVVGDEVGRSVADAIESMVGAVHAVGTDAICMALPEHGLEFDSNFDFAHSIVARRVIHDRLSALAERSPSCAFLDLAAAVPFRSPDNHNYFCDTVHFNATGYDMMGAKLFEVALPLLERRLAARAAQNDELTWSLATAADCIDCQNGAPRADATRRRAPCQRN
jgi:lysophospholipase L1-like esterase